MSKKKADVSTEHNVIDGDNYTDMSRVMLELAARGPYEEELIMRVANAGDVAPVVKEIKSRRVSRKKFQVKPSRVDNGAQPATARKGARGKKGRKGASAGAGAGARGASEGAGQEATA